MPSSVDDVIKALNEVKEAAEKSARKAERLRKKLKSRAARGQWDRIGDGIDQIRAKMDVSEALKQAELHLAKAKQTVEGAVEGAAAGARKVTSVATQMPRTPGENAEEISGRNAAPSGDASAGTKVSRTRTSSAKAKAEMVQAKPVAARTRAAHAAKESTPARRRKPTAAAKTPPSRPAKAAGAAKTTNASTSTVEETKKSSRKS